jgi:thymidine phosphorylase
MTTYLPQELIRLKREGHELAPEQIVSFIKGLKGQSTSPAQLAAFAMAVFFKGLTLSERVSLTRAMTESGTVLKWDVPGPVLDKHSTGGVGDAVSLVLAPMVAACGGFVPMISGRGLGHTGGTLDKLEAIPGYNAKPDLGTFQKIVREVGCAIIGQTIDLAPADQVFYAVRDVTATVESVDLITASILCKKLAAGLDGLVMDVKMGNGAFMTDHDEAQALADSIVTVSRSCGLSTQALLTKMDQPLASCAGNAVEVAYSIRYLKNIECEPRFHKVTMDLGAKMLVLGNLAQDEAEARVQLKNALSSGKAAEYFEKMVSAMGGPSDILEKMDDLPRAKIIRPVFPDREGHVRSINTRDIGLVVVGLGGGRTQVEQSINPSVGLTHLASLEQKMSRDVPVGIIHAENEASFSKSALQLKKSYLIE